MSWFVSSSFLLAKMYAVAQLFRFLPVLLVFSRCKTPGCEPLLRVYCICIFKAVYWESKEIGKRNMVAKVRGRLRCYGIIFLKYCTLWDAVFYHLDNE